MGHGFHGRTRIGKIIRKIVIVNGTLNINVIPTGIPLRYCERSGEQCGNLNPSRTETASAIKLPRSDVNFFSVQASIDDYKLSEKSVKIRVDPCPKNVLLTHVTHDRKFTI